MCVCARACVCVRVQWLHYTHRIVTPSRYCQNQSNDSSHYKTKTAVTNLFNCDCTHQTATPVAVRGLYLLSSPPLQEVSIPMCLEASAITSEASIQFSAQTQSSHCGKYQSHSRPLRNDWEDSWPPSQQQNSQICTSKRTEVFCWSPHVVSTQSVCTGGARPQPSVEGTLRLPPVNRRWPSGITSCSIDFS